MKSGESFSFSSWVYASNPRGKGAQLFLLTSTRAGEQDSISLHFSTTGDQLMRYRTVVSTDISTVSTTDAFPVEEWTLVQLVHGSGGDVTLFWNGIQRGSGTGIALPLSGGQQHLVVGGSYSSTETEDYFEGMMREGAFFRKAMNLYTLPSISIEALGAWRFQRRATAVPSHCNSRGGCGSRSAVNGHYLTKDSSCLRQARLNGAVSWGCYDKHNNRRNVRSTMARWDSTKCKVRKVSIRTCR